MNRQIDPNRLYELLCEIFGEEYVTRKKQFRINCINPECDDQTGNLEINLDRGIFHCWKCSYSGNIRELLRDYLGYIPPLDNYISPEQLRNFHIDFRKEIQEDKKFSGLPAEFCPLWEGKKLSLIGQKALQYVLGRLSPEEIKKYSIGYCGLGKYRWRIIIPSFEDSKVIYFVARTIFPNHEPRYLNPNKDECGVGADEVVFNIDFVREIGRAVVVEGVFDAISVGDDGVAIFGSDSISDEQVRKLFDIPIIYILLDRDARKKSLKIADRFQDYGKIVYIVSPPKGDPADWPREEIRKWIVEAKPYSFKDKLLITLGE